MPQITGKPPFVDVYEACYSYVFNAVYVRLLHREDAEDVTAATFFKAMEAYEDFDPARASVTTWLYRIAMNALNDHLRRSRRAELFPLDAAENAGEEDAELAALTDGAAQELLPILRRLDGGERKLLMLRYRMELTDAEIGDILSISRDAARQRLKRTLDKCRDIAAEL